MHRLERTPGVPVIAPPVTALDLFSYYVYCLGNTKKLRALVAPEEGREDAPAEADQHEGSEGRVQGAQRWTHVEGEQDGRRKRPIAARTEAQGEVVSVLSVVEARARA